MSTQITRISYSVSEKIAGGNITLATHLIEMSNSWTRLIADADALTREIAQTQELAGKHIAPNPPGFSAIQATASKRTLTRG